jgi:hypothetical protein
MKIIGIEGLTNEQINEDLDNGGKDVTQEVRGAIDVQALVS